ncbi:MAG: hypothetical protein AAGB34_04615 [Planctomycetota bacterium]
MRIGPSNLPFHIARAYGASSITPHQKVQPIEAIKRNDAASRAEDKPKLSNIHRLVAAVVPGGVDFDASGTAQASESAMPMYARPGEANSVATRVQAAQAGRIIDTRG